VEPVLVAGRRGEAELREDLCHEGRVRKLAIKRSRPPQARSGKDPGRHYEEIAALLGRSYYTRIHAPATPEQGKGLAQFRRKPWPRATWREIPSWRSGRAPGTDAPIGGLKVVTDRGWFAARPSDTEMICKLSAENFTSQAHLDVILAEAQEIVGRALTR
jgi:phosphoglucomutase